MAAIAGMLALTGCSNGPESTPIARSATTIIVSGGDLGSQSDPSALVATVDHALHTKVRPGTGSRSGFSGPPVSKAGDSCLRSALGDAGTQAGALLFVADLTWQGTPSFLYAMKYTPHLVRRARTSSSSTTVGRRPPDRLLLVVADTDCHLETATIAS